MLNLTQPNFKKIRDLLLKQQQKVEQEIKAIEKDDPVHADALAESMEPGTESWLADVHSRAVAMKQGLVQISARIKHALVALKTGKYGKCEKCGKLIEPARLEVMPTATLCIACSKKSTKK